MEEYSKQEGKLYQSVVNLKVEIAKIKIEELG